jgi:hypothetical protein
MHAFAGHDGGVGIELVAPFIAALVAFVTVAVIAGELAARLFVQASEPSSDRAKPGSVR